MTTEDGARVWRHVWRVLGQWQADFGAGSARAVFEAAWREATPDMPRELLERERAWRHWLRSGTPHTGGLPWTPREPGEEG
jgi:hypothetical protein